MCPSGKIRSLAGVRGVAWLIRTADGVFVSSGETWSTDCLAASGVSNVTEISSVFVWCVLYLQFLSIIST